MVNNVQVTSGQFAGKFGRLTGQQNATKLQVALNSGRLLVWKESHELERFIKNEREVVLALGEWDG